MGEKGRYSFGFLIAIITSTVGCSMQVDIKDRASTETKVEVKAPVIAEITSGSSSHRTPRNYTVETQLGNPFSSAVSTTERRYTIYHSVKLSPGQ